MFLIKKRVSAYLDYATFWSSWKYLIFHFFAKNLFIPSWRNWCHQAVGFENLDSPYQVTEKILKIICGITHLFISNNGWNLLSWVENLRKFNPDLCTKLKCVSQIWILFGWRITIFRKCQNNKIFSVEKPWLSMNTT